MTKGQQDGKDSKDHVADYFTDRTASAYMGGALTASGLQHLRLTGRLPYSRVGKRVVIRRRDLDALVESSRVEHGPGAA